MTDIIDFNYIINRDLRNSNIFLHENEEIMQLIRQLFDYFISFDNMNNQIISKKNNHDKEKLVIIDTCSFLLNDLNYFSKPDTTYIITCGVFLEIL